jgi:ribonuclease D
VVAEQLLIDEPGRLADVLGTLDPDVRWALDTEFVRERTYFPRLCLVQAAVAGRVVLVDPLRIGDPGLLRSFLSASRRPRIVHAARQDVEVLLPVTGEPLAPLFDTQVAASLLGFPAQVGYGELVRQLLGVELAKGHARTDWAARPLKEAQLAYAADDVRFLGPAAEELEARLAAAGRLAWLEEDCAALSDPALYRNEPAQAWRRLKGLERMRPEERAVARALATWREEVAVRRDLPRGWVMTDDALREIARLRPDSDAALQRVPSLPESLARRRGDQILQQVRDAVASAGAAAEAPALERLTPEQQTEVRRLQDVLQAVAADVGVTAEVLATRRDLVAVVRGARDLPPLRGWRRAVVGEALLAAAG